MSECKWVTEATVLLVILVSPILWRVLQNIYRDFCEWYNELPTCDKVRRDCRECTYQLYMEFMTVCRFIPSVPSYMWRALQFIGEVTWNIPSHFLFICAQLHYTAQYIWNISWRDLCRKTSKDRVSRGKSASGSFTHSFSARESQSYAHVNVEISITYIIKCVLMGVYVATIICLLKYILICKESSP